MRQMTEAQTVAELNQWKALVRSFAIKGTMRLHGAGVCIDLEDVESQMTESFLRAQRSFNPDFGVTISAYAGKAILQNFNRWAEKLIRERIEHGVRQVGELESAIGDDADFWELTNPDQAVMANSIAAMVEDPMEIVARRQEVGRLLESLSKEARAVLQLVVMPTPELQRVHKLWTDKLSARRDAGERITVPMSIDADFVMECMRLDDETKRRVKKELAMARQVGQGL